MQTAGRIVQEERLEGRLEETTARVAAVAGDDDGAGEVGIALALEFLQPSPHRGMAGGTAHGVAGVLEVVPLGVGTLRGAERVDDDAAVHRLRAVRQVFAELHALGGGGDGLGGAHRVRPRHHAKGIEVAHAAAHVEVNDPLRRGGLLQLRGRLKGRGHAARRETIHHRDAKAGFREAAGKVTAGEIVAGKRKRVHAAETQAGAGLSGIFRIVDVECALAG